MPLISAGSWITAMTSRAIARTTIHSTSHTTEGRMMAIFPPQFGLRKGSTSSTFARNRAHALFRAAPPTSTASPAVVSTSSDAGPPAVICARPYQRSGVLVIRAGRSFHLPRPRDEYTPYRRTGCFPLGEMWRVTWAIKSRLSKNRTSPFKWPVSGAFHDRVSLSGFQASFLGRRVRALCTGKWTGGQHRRRPVYPLRRKNRSAAIRAWSPPRNRRGGPVSGRIQSLCAARAPGGWGWRRSG